MYALADGHQLYPTPDGTWHYLTPDENAGHDRRAGRRPRGTRQLSQALWFGARPGSYRDRRRPRLSRRAGCSRSSARDSAPTACADGRDRARCRCLHRPALQGSSASRGRIHYCANRRRRCVVGPRTVGCRCSSSRRVVGTRDLVPPKPNTVATRPRGAGRDLHRTLLRRYRQRKLPGRLRSTACRVARPGSSAGTVESPRRQRTSPART